MSDSEFSYPKSKIKVLLLEGVHIDAASRFRTEEFNVEYIKHALTEEELCEKIKGVHMLGIRSKSKVTENVLSHANRLLAIGCFCIGTNQVALTAAAKKGVAVFNSPFCNSRSVAELIIAQIITLSRKLGDQNKEMHAGVWNKSSAGSREIRGKTLGIVGYGHIGSQLSVLAESMGMTVIFYDVIQKLPLGNAKPIASLSGILAQADFLSLHVPQTPSTQNMIGSVEINEMKKGSYLLNASRGTVVSIPALKEALESGHLAGAYVDVFPQEPKSNGNFSTGLEGLPNLTLTPHIGGSTEEAQRAIGLEVSNAMVKNCNQGLTAGAVNFPNISMAHVDVASEETHRILNVHLNIPGVMKEVNRILGDYNVVAETLRTTGTIGYLIVDVDRSASTEIMEAIEKYDWNIRTRVLY